MIMMMAPLLLILALGLVGLLVHRVESLTPDSLQSDSTDIEVTEVDIDISDLDELDEEELREKVEELADLSRSLDSDCWELEGRVEELESEVETLREERDEAEEKVSEFHDRVDPDGAIELEPPHMSTSTFGLVEDLYREWRHRQKEKKLARKGYVKWRIVRGNSLSRPKYVKPKRNGEGVPEITYDGDTYLFDRDAMVASASNGMWTCFHKAGELDPIPVSDPLRQGIPTDTVDEWLTMRVTSSPPSFWDKWDIDSQDVLTYSMAAIIALAGLQQFL